MTRGQRVCGAELKIGAMDIGQPHLFSLVLRSLVSLLHTHTGVVKTQQRHSHLTSPQNILSGRSTKGLLFVCKQLSLSGFRSVSLSQHKQPAPIRATQAFRNYSSEKFWSSAIFWSYWWLDRVFRIVECDSLSIKWINRIMFQFWCCLVMRALVSAWDLYNYWFTVLFVWAASQKPGSRLSFLFFFNSLLIVFCRRYRLSKYSVYNILENTLCLVENLWGLFCSVQTSMTH